MTECAECGKQDGAHKCEYCRNAVYCDELCAKRNWAAHQKDCNAYDVAKDATIAVPYYYQDLASENELRGADLEDLFQQKRVLRTINTDGTVDRRVQADFADIGKVLTSGGTTTGKVEFFRVKPFKYGEAPNIQRYGDSYRIIIRQNQWLVPTGDVAFGPRDDFRYEDLSMKDDMIYMKNEANNVAAALAKSRRLLGKNRDVYVFYPGSFEPPYVIDGRGGNLEVIVETYWKESGDMVSRASISLNYEDLHFKGRGKLGKATRKLTGLFSRQLKLKGLSAENHAALYAKNSKSLEVRLIYSTKGMGGIEKYLEDIELVVPVNELSISHQGVGAKVSPNESVKFSCDARDIDKVTGLYLALEKYVAELKEEANGAEGSELREKQSELKSVLKTKALVNEHRQDFQKFLQKEGRENAHKYQITSQVNSAVFDAQKKLWDRHQELIGLRGKEAFDKSYYKRHKDDDYYSLRAQVNTLGIPEKGEKFSERLRAWALGKRGKAKGRLRAIEQIIREKRAAMNLRPEEEMKNTRYLQWVELTDRVSEALAQ